MFLAMKIILNGQDHILDQTLTLTQLVEKMSKNPRHVIAEVNGNIVKSDHWTATPVCDNDTIELVTFVGGG
jgi:sulfur carrier protein